MLDFTLFIENEVLPEAKQIDSDAEKVDQLISRMIDGFQENHKFDLKPNSPLKLSNEENLCENSENPRHQIVLEQLPQFEREFERLNKKPHLELAGSPATKFAVQKGNLR